MRRARKSLLWGLAVLLLPIAPLAAGGLWFLYLAGEGTWTAALKQATAAASGPDMQISADGFRRDDSGVVRLESLQLADSEGVWLRVSGVAADLSSAALFGGTVQLNEVSAERVEVLRAPVSETTPATTESDPFTFPDKLELPQLPVAISLSNLRIDEILLAEGLVPERLRLALKGTAEATNNAIGLEIDLAALDLDNSHLRMTLSGSTVTGVIQADVSADLPLIAPFAEQLGAPDDSRVTFNLAGGGELARSRFEFGTSVDGVTDVIGEIKLGISPDTGATIDMNAFLNMIGGVTAEPAQLVGETLEVSARMDLPTPERINVQHLRIDSRFLTARIRATADLTEGTLTTALQSRLRHHTGLDELLQGALFDVVDIDGTATGPFDQLQTKMNLTVGRPSFDTFASESVKGAVEAKMTEDGATGTLKVDVLQPRTGTPDLDAIAGATVTLQTRFEVKPAAFTLNELSFTTAFAQLQGRLSLAPDAGVVDGVLDLSVDNLDNAPQLADLLSGGTADVQVNLGGLSATDGTVEVVARLDGLKWRDQTIASLTGSTVKLDSKMRLVSGNLAIDTNLQTTAGPTARVNARVTEGFVDADYLLSVPQLPPHIAPPDVKGLADIRLAGRVDGALTNLKLSGRLTSNDVTMDQITVERPELSFQIADLTGNPRLQWQGGASLIKSPLAIAGAAGADLKGNRVTVSDLTVAWRSMNMTADAEIDLQTTLATATGDLKIGDVGDLSDLAGTELSGNLDAAFSASHDGQQQNADITLTGRKFAAAGATLADLSVRLGLSDVLATAPGLTGTITANDLGAEGVRIQQAIATIAGSTLSPTADLQVKALEPAAATLSSVLSADLADTARARVTVTELGLVAPEGGIHAQRPFTVDLAGDLIELTNLDLTSTFGGHITGDALYAPDRILAELDIVDVPLGPILELSGSEGFEGSASATVRVNTAESEDRASVRIDLAELALPDLPSDTPFRAALLARWSGDQMVAEAEIAGPFDQPLVATFAGALPAIPGVAIPEPPTNGPIEGRLSWQGDLRALLALLPESDHLAQGPVSIDMTVGGVWSEPRLAGEVAVTNAEYENLLSGTHLRQIGLDVRFDDTGTGRMTLSAAGPEGGAVSGTGDMVLLGEDKNAQVTINLRNLLAVRRDEARVLISGDTTVNWDGTRVAVNVRKQLDRVDIYLAAPDLPPSVVAIELERDRVPEPEEPTATLPVDLDVEISAPGQFFVRGRGLESEWSGTFSVKGPTDNPVINSRFEAVRGSLALLGRDFRLDRGELGLDESFNPTFRIDLVRETPDLTGRIVVSGNPAQPDISFSSEPELPQDEVLPRVLFDKAKQSLSPLEAVNLAQGIRTLTNGKPGTTDQIRDAVGLDVLRFEESDDPESAGSVSVGRYVRDGVYVGAKKSVDSEAGSVVVEIDLLPNVKVDAEVGQGGGGSTGITWEKKY